MADLLEDGALLEEDGDRPAAPWHFWAVAAVGLLWNSFGAIDYTMTQLRNPAWIGQIDAEMLAKIDAAPVWATSCWALGVWGSFAGAVLLLVRSRHAAAAFAVSFVAALVSFAWQYSAGLVASPILPMVILAAVAFFWWYAGKMRTDGVLT
ncbi:hypothetical protein [Novosphingobium sp. Gsoil 351]|uniref:hypothetical protein n=1 Tax=Novosphingobium sp. Gsoil 351 TaxID=2675225 RepID=UPI0012B47E20|nr:hypothetical protein [Novosphingobium sp. Gsoil 351]QGN56185.1 hypothetical protein GKE62_18160 [Novosphingobium sp. Gsoil 351]